MADVSLILRGNVLTVVNAAIFFFSTSANLGLALF